ncbi:AAA family ATPase [Mycolicibacterium goodii]|uniref:AAA family ATPase n=1 Tax=Mycolicibacterium goodii TaxID=134601 RepID=A0ABS6HK44_MYCGD|nr:adenylate/guanylate cyclase domain-containing protein [Mycolicibacterium goodii]MBU8822686.1 AAA family ATPase [Mycolicibacterium goodii]MBU8839572.1 AAA family ATPase [Mycolicibacterium goodii]
MAACGMCGTELRPSARFCDSCGTAVLDDSKHAEYKQVTVLFADVVDSMRLAGAVGAERLREILSALMSRCSGVVERYGGTVDKFTGDGIMALFGAPVALEDHALRACLAALDLQNASRRLADDLDLPAGVGLQMRIGLNSGQVIAGEMATRGFGYTAIGEQVGMAQRMESVAPHGGIMCSDTTARLVEDAVLLGEPETVHIKGFDSPVTARRLLATTASAHRGNRSDPSLVGRTWELNTIAGLLDEAIEGRGCIVNVVGPPGIGKSRMVRESIELARRRGVPVFYTYCESHASDIPFHIVVPLLREGFGVAGLEPAAARARARALVPDADPEDLLLLDDVLGIADPDVPTPDVDADARRRRLAALVNAASLARQEPGLYVLEDAHWIDEVSESMLAEFLAVVTHTHSVMLITYRPEYTGVLARVSGAQTIALRPLTEGQTSTLLTELLGSAAAAHELTCRIAERAAGNPFFAQEIVRDLAERGVLRGERGAYRFHGADVEVGVPATLQATIAARIDRLDASAKHTLSAAAVIGLRFGPDLLAALGADDAALQALIDAELIDQVTFAPRAEYTFRHPLIRMVALESQLIADRAELHRRLAADIERHTHTGDENAALIAEHYEAAGDLGAAFTWHMRAGRWLTNRDINAARLSWQRARHVADRLPHYFEDRAAMAIAPRTLLCLSTWRAGGHLEETGFDELCKLAAAADDKVSLATGMAGQVSALLVHAHYRESSRLSSELTSLLESIGDRHLTVALLYAALGAKFQTGEAREAARLADRIIELADGDAGMGNLIIGSPLVTAWTVGGLARACLGDPRWRTDIDRATRLVGDFGITTRALMLTYRCIGLPTGLLLPSPDLLQESGDVLEVARRSADDLALAGAQISRGLLLLWQDRRCRDEALELLRLGREASVREQFTMAAVAAVDTELARDKAVHGDLDSAIELGHAVVDASIGSGEAINVSAGVTVLVQALIERGGHGDLEHAQQVVDRLAALPVDPGFVLYEVPLMRLRALLARAWGDEAAYRECAARYRDLATAYGYEGHMALAARMA